MNSKSIYLVSLRLSYLSSVEALCGQQLPPLLMTSQPMLVSINGATVGVVFSSSCRTLRAVLSTFDTLSATGVYCVSSACHFLWNVCSACSSEYMLVEQERVFLLELSYQVHILLCVLCYLIETSHMTLKHHGL